MKEQEYERYILSTRPTLWLPLYRKGGDTILSSDGHGFLGTSTGAIWELRGRAFNGTSSQITLPTDSNFALNQSSFTISGWMYPTILDNFAPMIMVGSGAYVNGFQMAVNRLLFDDNLTNAYNPITNFFLNTWVYYTAVHDLSNHRVLLYGGNNLISITAYAGTGLNTQTGNTVTVGATIGSTLYYLTGVVGEVLIFNRALSAGEISHIYQATRWRYQ